MSAFGRLARTELRLFLRDPAATLAALVLPAAFMALFGVVFGAEADDPRLAGFFPAAALIMGTAQLAVNLTPATLAGYREKGILRRMATTPVHPARLLAAQLAVSALLAAGCLVAVLAVGRLAFGFPLPAAAAPFLVSFTLSTLALLAVGLLIAAVAPTARAATALGVAVFFGCLAVGGVFVPAESLPEFMAAIGGHTPVGAGMDALRDSWTGAWPRPRALLVPAAYVLIATPLAARVFRWE